MKTIFDALYTKFLGSALDTAVGGRYFPIEAPIGTDSPLVVASIISETPSHELSYTFVDVLIEISAIADNITTMHSVSELVFSLFDKCTLSGILNYRQLGPMEREIAQPLIEDGVFRYAIEYRLSLQKV